MHPSPTSAHGNAAVAEPQVNLLQLMNVAPDPDHFVVSWQVQQQLPLPGNPYLALVTAASESLLLAANNASGANQVPMMLGLHVDYFPLRLNVQVLVVEVNVLHQQEKILCLEAYLYGTGKLLAKASATFSA